MTFFPGQSPPGGEFGCASKRAWSSPATAAAILLVLWVALTKIPVAWNEDRWDSRWFQLAGLMFLDGETPYQDFWDNKPPGIFLLGAIGGLFSDTSLVQFAVMDGLFNLLSLLVASRLIRFFVNQETPAGRPRRLGFEGWLCLILAAVLTSHTALMANGNLTESYLILPEALTIAAGLGLLRRSNGEEREVTTRDAFLAGVFGALAAWIRPTGLAGFGALELTWLVYGRWRLGIAALFGLAVGLFPGVAIFWWWGALSDLVHACIVVPLQASYEVRVSPLVALRNLRPVAWPALVVAGWALWRVAGLSHTKRTPGSEARAAALAWVIMDLAGALLPGHYRQHYFLPLALSLPVAAAIPVSAAWRASSKRESRLAAKWGARLLAATTLVWIVAWMNTELRHILSARSVEDSVQPWMQVVRFLRSEVSPGDRVFVVDYAPSINVLTKTRPATPLVGIYWAHADGLTVESAREAAFREALKTRPVFIVNGPESLVPRAVGILTHRAARVFACAGWEVWRPLDRRRGERVVGRWQFEPGRPAGWQSVHQARDTRSLHQSDQRPAVETEHGVEIPLPPGSSQRLIVSVAFRDPMRPVYLEIDARHQIWRREIGGAGSRDRLESIEIPFPPNDSLLVRTRFADGTTFALGRIELATVTKRMQDRSSYRAAAASTIVSADGSTRADKR